METCSSPPQFDPRIVGTNMPVGITETTIDGTEFVATSVKVDVWRVTDNQQIVTQANASIDNQNPTGSHSYTYGWNTAGYQPGAYNTVWTRTASDGTVNVIRVSGPVEPPVGLQ